MALKESDIQTAPENGSAGTPTPPRPPAPPAGRGGLDPGMENALQRMTDDLLRILSARSWWQRLRLKVWRHNQPELQKVFGVIHNNLVEIQRLLILRHADPPHNLAAIEQQLRAFLNEEHADLSRINIHAAWEYAGALERFLLLLGDDEYLAARLLHEEQREKKARLGAWSEYLAADALTALITEFAKRPIQPEIRARAVECLSYIYAERIRYVRHQRAREELRADYLNGLTFFLALLLLLLLECIHLAAKPADSASLSQTIRSLLGSLLTFNVVIDIQSEVIRSALVAAVTGALGSTLSGFYRLRDEAGGITALRAFRSAMWAQPFVGAVVGVILWLLLTSGLINVGAAVAGRPMWANLGIYCFVAGFSEPFFLGLVQRVAGAADKDATRPSAPPQKPDGATA